MNAKMREIKNGFVASFERNGTQMHGTRRIGPELEFPIVDVRHGRASTQCQIVGVFRSLASNGNGWKMAQDGTSVSKHFNDFEINVGTDMGTGTMEIGFRPVRTLNEAESGIREVLGEVKPALCESGLMVLGYGVQPLSNPGRDIMMEKDRYHMLVKLVGPEVYRHTITAANQVHFEVGVDEIADSVNALNAASPAIIALSANSLVVGGRRGDTHDERVLSWDKAMARDYARMRVGVPRSFRDFDSYWEELMDFKPFMIKRDGEYMMFEPERTGSMREYISNGSGTAHDLRGREIMVIPEVNDAKMLQGTVWWEARLSPGYGTIEFRTASLQPSVREIVAIDAIALGLLENRHEVLKRISRYTRDELQDARIDAARRGFAGRIDGNSIETLARDMIEIANDGLKSVGEDTSYLDVFRERLEEKRNPADRSVEVLEKKGLNEFLRDVELRM